MKELPSAWAKTNLGNLTEYVTSGSRDWSKYYAEAGVLFVRTQDINTNKLAEPSSIAKVCLPASVEGKRTLIRRGDLLITITGANVGRCAHVAAELPEAYVSQSVALVRLRDPSFGRFVHLQLLAPSDSSGRTNLEASAYGMGRPVLNLDNVRETPLLIPPRQEQQRIADKLDTVLTRVDAVNTRLACVAHILKRFRQSVLAAATSGRLTDDWRSNEAPAWSELLFSDAVLESSTGLVRSATDQAPMRDGLTQYLKMSSIGEMWGYQRNDLPGVHCSKEEFNRYELEHGDWLFNTRNSVELVGKSCVWNGPAGVVFNNNLLRVRFKAAINPMWVEIYFRSPIGRNVLNAVKSATTSVAAIYQRSLMELPLKLPPEREQTEIVRRVETLFAFATRLEARLQTAQTVTERLTPALLAKAFRGELVPQDPNDEPASELLRRLQADRRASKSMRGRKAAA